MVDPGAWHSTMFTFAARQHRQLSVYCELDCEGNASSADVYNACEPDVSRLQLANSSWLERAETFANSTIFPDPGAHQARSVLLVPSPGQVCNTKRC